MGAKVMLTGFHVNDEPEYSDTRKMVTFSVVSDKYYNNQKIKLYVSGFDETVDLIRRLKMKKGSFVDIVATMLPYSKNGEHSISYKIDSISYSEFQAYTEGKKEEKKEKKEERNEADKIMEAARILAGNPFI